MSLRIGSLCTGYGGLDMAVEAVLGGELAWVADNDPGAAAILADRFPSARNLGDITAVDWATVMAVAILIAGFPCQDVSAAGARAGLRAGTRSGLWLQIVEAIRALRPRLVVIENVRGLLTARGDDPTPEHLAAEAAAHTALQLLQWLQGETNLAMFKGDRRRAKQCRARTARVVGLRKRLLARCEWHERRLVRAIGTVLGSLADLGYDAQWTVVSAVSAGAPHLRERVFILAWPAADASGDEPGWHGALPGDIAGQPGRGPRPGHRLTAAHPNRPAGGERWQPASGEAEGRRPRADAGGRGGASAADAAGDGRHQGRPESARIIGGPDAAIGGDGLAVNPDSGGRRPHEHDLPARERDADRGAPADAERGGRDGRPPLPERGTPERVAPAGASRGALEWGPYASAIARWEAVTGRPAPRPTKPGRTGERLSPRFVEWMQGLPAGWVTDVPGLSRNAQLKALGNGVVPQQAEMALRLLLAAVERPGVAA